MHQPGATHLPAHGQLPVRAAALTSFLECVFLHASDLTRATVSACVLLSQVGFRDYKAVLKTKVLERVNAVVNRLNGTKRDVPHPDLAGEREAYEREVHHWQQPQTSGHRCTPHLLHSYDAADFHIPGASAQISVCASHRLGCCEQVRQVKKAETQAQKKAEKAAKEAAEREKDLRSYKHIMQVGAAHGPDLLMLDQGCGYF